MLGDVDLGAQEEEEERGVRALCSNMFMYMETYIGGCVVWRDIVKDGLVCNLLGALIRGRRHECFHSFVKQGLQGNAHDRQGCEPVPQLLELFVTCCSFDVLR